MTLAVHLTILCVSWSTVVNANIYVKSLAFCVSLSSICWNYKSHDFFAEDLRKQVGKTMTQIQKRSPQVTKVHYQINTPTGLSKAFSKVVYRSHNSSDFVIVQYCKDTVAAVDFLHGNTKRPVNFLPTAKSVKKQLENKVTKLTDLQSETAHEPEQFQPRNANQKCYFESKSSITTDSLLVLHELAYILPGFLYLS